MRSTRASANNFSGAAIAGTDPVRLTQQAIDLGQECGEVDLVMAGFAGGDEVGARPVAFLGGELGVRSRAKPRIPWDS